MLLLCFLAFVFTDPGNDLVTSSGNDFAGIGNDFAGIGNDPELSIVTTSGNESLPVPVMIAVTSSGNDRQVS